MTCLVHLSDLHFGRVEPDLVRPLVETVNDLAPDLVAISGDLTQRARIPQFKEARRFMDALDPPVYAVPGNHDTPLDNLFVRLLRPWSRWKETISPELEPTVETDDFVLIGLNSVNPYDWQRGRLGKRAADRITRFKFAGDPRPVVVMLHHPLEEVPGDDKSAVRGAERAMEALGAAGADVVLSGHLHTTHITPLKSLPSCLFVQAGTPISTRLRDEGNAFNLLDLSEHHAAVTRYGWDGNGFTAEESRRFARATDAWRPLADGTDAEAAE